MENIGPGNLVSFDYATENSFGNFQGTVESVSQETLTIRINGKYKTFSLVGVDNLNILF